MFHIHGLMKPKVLYVSDLDGTLLNAQSVISPESARMLNTAIADGALFTAATARTPATVVELLKPLEMQMPAVVMTGAALFDTRDKTYSRVCYFPEGITERLIGMYRRAGVATFVYTLEQEILQVYHIGELNDFEKMFISQRCHSPYKRFNLPPTGGDSVLPESFPHTVLIFSVQPWEPAEALYNRIKGERVPCTPLCYHDAFGPDWAELEIFGPTTSKAAAVEALASDVGADRLVVFGDNVNDLSLFAIADEGIAVSNAIPEVREAASDVIGPNTDDSVARFILNHTS